MFTRRHTNSFIMTWLFGVCILLHTRMLIPSKVLLLGLLYCLGVVYSYQKTLNLLQHGTALWQLFEVTRTHAQHLPHALVTPTSKDPLQIRTGRDARGPQHVDHHRIQTHQQTSPSAVPRHELRGIGHPLTVLLRGKRQLHCG